LQIIRKVRKNLMSFVLALDAFTEGLTSRKLSVLQQLQSLSVDRPYCEFSFKELEAATTSFSPGKFKSH